MRDLRFLYGRHTIKIHISTTVRSRIGALAESLDRPVAEVCRTLIWMGLPILEGIEHAQTRGISWWNLRVGRETETPAEDPRASSGDASQ